MKDPLCFDFFIFLKNEKNYILMSTTICKNIQQEQQHTNRMLELVVLHAKQYQQ